MIELNANYTFDIDFEIHNKKTSVISTVNGIDEAVQAQFKMLEMVDYSRKNLLVSLVDRESGHALMIQPPQ